MRAAHSADHRLPGIDSRALTDPVRPRPGGIDDPRALHPLFCSAQLVAQQHAFGASIRDVHGEYLGMVASHCAGADRFYQPLGDQALGELALRVLKVEERPFLAGIEQALQLVLFDFRVVDPQPLPAEAAI